MAEKHAIMGGKVHVYRRDHSSRWQCSTYLGGKNRRVSTKENGLSRAKDFAEDWYLELRGKLRNGELKSGGFKVQQVVEQLDGGAAVAHGWIPNGCAFDFVPVLVHGKGVHRRDIDRLRAARITLRNQTRQVELIRCHQPLANALQGT